MLDFIKKNIIYMLVNTLIMSAMLTLLMYFSLDYYTKYFESSTQREYPYQITLFDAFPVALFYVFVITILFLIASFTLKRIIDFSKFKYLIGFFIAFAFIFIFKSSVGFYDLKDNMINIEILSVSLFGCVVAKNMSKCIKLT